MAGLWHADKQYLNKINFEIQGYLNKINFEIQGYQMLIGDRT